MDRNRQQFEQRIARIDPAHAGRARKARARSKPWILRLPWRGIFAAAICFLTVKSFLIWSVGPVLFSARMDEMLQGVAYQQWVAWLLRPDPITLWLGGAYDMVARWLGL